jgi:hypothetical protein
MGKFLVRGLRDGIVVHALGRRVHVDIQRLDGSDVRWRNGFLHNHKQAKKD